MNQDPFKEYIKQSEPDKRDKGYAWHTAIGLQAVDGLKTSKYLIDTAIKNIEGDISIDEVQELLHNRSMHIHGQFIQSANPKAPKSQNGTLKLTPDELSIVKLLIVEPSATQKRISESIGISERTVKRRTVEMQEKGLICRENGKRNGRWKVLIELQ